MHKLKYLFLLFIVLNSNTQAKETRKMENEQQAIRSTIETYVDGYLNAKKELVAKAFYSETRLYSLDEGKIDKTEMADWLKNLDDRSARQDIRRAELDIGFIDITGETAVAKITLRFESRTFVDYLSFLKWNDAWVIVGKIYSVEENKH